ncbi:MAG TPA: hypothetical protein VIV08_02280 [Acidimicrobiia bacterium]
MIELYRASRSPDADRTEEALRDLVVAHTVHVVADPDDAPGGILPVVREGDRLVLLPDIPAYLEEVRRLMAEWRRFQSDACFVADDGGVC